MDYQFGEKLYNLRKSVGLTQNQVAMKLGVTNKAISKWENGKTKPQVEMIRKLSVIYKTSVDKLLQILEEESEPKITKIVLTGGPCSGKTTAMSWIQNALSERGYKVIFIPETATELLTAGVMQNDYTKNVKFQKVLMEEQISKENIYEKAARNMNCEKILMVFDRGIMDGKAYISDVDFSILLNKMNLNEIEVRDQYDAVFHLETAAKSEDDSLYTLGNSGVRSENPQKAIEVDDNLIKAWTGHPHFRVIKNENDFSKKMKNLIREITNLLGEPEPYEIERKFLIEYPDLKKLEQNPYCKKVNIIQTYLQSIDGHEIRLRQRGDKGAYIYYKTEKVTVSNIKRIEIEERLTEKEYLNLLMKADTTHHQIRKNRYCLMENGQYFEIDIFPFWSDKAILEVELTNEKQDIIFPKEIKIIKEVTNLKEYKNFNLAQNNSNEFTLI